MSTPLAKLIAVLTPKRKWFQFRLATVFIVVAAICVWLSVEVEQANRQRDAVAAIRESGGWVRYDFQFVKGKFDPDATARVAAWLKAPMGQDFFHHVVEVNLVYNDDTKQRLDNRNESAAVLRHLTSFPRLKWLLLHGGQASDEAMAYVGKLRELEKIYMWDAKYLSDTGIAHLAHLRQLKSIHASNAQLTDESLRVFGRMSRIESLSLQGNHFTDRGLEHLAGLTHLSNLWIGIGDCQVTDAGLSHLKGLPVLTRLEIQQSKVTDAGIAEFQQALPKCQILR
jgi:hypothetical protein